jgi:chromosome segregation ATPase
MNKERLELEKQLSIHRIAQQKISHSTKLPQSTSLSKTKVPSSNQPLLQKELSKKSFEIQKLQKELQQAKTNKTSIDSRKEEIRQLKLDINQLQHQVREVPGLKSELQKNRQQVARLNEVILVCRRENNSQKSLITKQEKDINSKEARAKQYLKECEQLTNGLSERDKSINQLKEMVFSSEEENRLYKMQCESLFPLVERLEFVTDVADKFKANAHQKIKHLTRCLDDKTSFSKAIEEQLQSSRSESAVLTDQCANLKHQMSELTSQVDIGHLEISRQKGVIKSLQQELYKLKAENAMYQEHLELVQCQNMEMNMFLEEEKRTLQETAKEMEIELVSSKHRGEKVEQLEVEVKLSKSLVMEKQEELDATQSQAHFIIQQLQNEITDAQEALGELWDTLGPLLKRFREQARVGLEDKAQELDDNVLTSTPGLSLVQSVLTAAALGNQSKLDNNDEDDDDDIVTLCSQIDDIKQGLVELADIGYGQTASAEAQNIINQLKLERNSMEQQHTTTIKSLNRDLVEYRSRDKKQLYTTQRQQIDIENLVSTLQNTRENYLRVNKENESISGLLEEKFVQKEQILDLKDQLQRKEAECKKILSEKECFQEQLTEATNRMSELSTDGSHDPGKILEEKFAAERKLKQMKEKWMELRLKADDNMNEHKLTTTRKIMGLEKSLKHAESEVVRLDQALEKIRLVLQRNPSAVNDYPSILNVVQFLNGDKTALL